MENDNQHEFEFLKDEDSVRYFAHVDFDLKSGKHIQNHFSQFYEFVYVEKFYDSLKNYYDRLFGVPLTMSSYGLQDYYYLEFNDDKGSFKGNHNEKLSSRYTLFGILLLKIHRLDRHFGDSKIGTDDLKDYLKDSSNAYRDDIYRLFAKVQSKDLASEPDEQNVDSWIENSLNKFEQLGWIFFEDDRSDITILPSFNRLFEMYKDTISNFDKITSDEDKT